MVRVLHHQVSDSISVLVSGFWRLLNEGVIILVSLDHAHIFGLPSPVDLSSELTDILKGKNLIRINVAKGTGDLRLFFTEKIIIKIFISSTGYESYQFSLSNKQYIGLVGGAIAVFQT